jgi:hypothetical protein
LETHEVRYLVIGGIAAILHGVPSVTLDADFLIENSLENATRLLAALREAGLGTAFLIEADALLAEEITIFKDRVRVIVMTKAPGLDFETAWARKETPAYDGQRFNMLCKADLTVSKKAAGRPQDLEDARLLELYRGCPWICPQKRCASARQSSWGPWPSSRFLS